MRHTFLAAVLTLAVSPSVFSQNTADALRYTRIHNAGTARMAGVGGAFSALGADFGALSLNPAGLSMYRSNEFVFTPGVHSATTSASLPSASNFDDTSSKLRIANLGMVFPTTLNSGKWKSRNVGLGFNQLGNYNQSAYYEGAGSGSILDSWFAEAEPFLAGGGNPDQLYPLGAGLGYKAGAIYFQGGVPSYDFLGATDATIDRTQVAFTSGSNNEMTFAVSGNYDERLMIGASIGVPLINYRQESFYTERDPEGGFEGRVPYFSELEYSDFLRTTGVGFNAKLGAILRISQLFRIGGAVHTPSYYNMTDQFSADFDYTYEDLNPNGGGLIQTNNTADASADPFNYRLKTPWRATGGLAFVMKYGFLSADVEWVDYSAASFNLTKSFNDADTRAFERDLNTAIQRNFKATANYKLGGELALDIFRLRGGFNVLGKPQANQSGYNTAWSAGTGVRFDKIYLDIAYRRSSFSGSVSPYSGSAAPTATTKGHVGDVLATVAIRF